MSTRDVSLAPPARGARPQGAAASRVDATLNVNVAARDRRGSDVVLSGAIGGRPRFDPSAATKQRHSPGELGHARDPARAPPRAARRATASASEGEPDAVSGTSGSGEPARRRTAPLPPTASTTGLAGLPGLGVYLGELGSPAKGDAETRARSSAGMILGRGLRSVPSLADIAVSIGGDPARGRGIGRLAAPLRALMARRPSRASVSAAGPAVSAAPTPRLTAVPAVAAAAPPAAAPLPAAEPESEAEVAPASRLRRASTYLVNGLLDIAIRRFRAAPRGGDHRRRG